MSTRLEAMTVDLQDIRREMIEDQRVLDLPSIGALLGLLAVYGTIILFLSPPPVVAIAVGAPLVLGSHRLFNLLRVKSLKEISSRQWWKLGAMSVASGLALAVLFAWGWPGLSS
jgi:hypothetical protein